MTHDFLISLWQRGGMLLGGVPLVVPVESVDAAQPQAAVVQNPLTWENVLAWLALHGPRLAVIIGCMWLFKKLLHIGSDRLVKLMDLASSRGTSADRENRARTLASVLRSTATALILIGGVLMILQELAIPVTPLLGGVAVVGLAVAFGAQNLIKDYFTGLMILLEDQYGVNDVVQIGNVTGQVERITLRVTMLRDLDGTAHFVPHGQVTVVSNRTHGWSRAVVDVAVGYSEDIDRAIATLMDVAAELRRDETFGPVITADAEMLGVDSLSDTAVNLKFCVRTRPMQQWKVKRELLKRIKIKFDEVGIKVKA